MQSKWISGNSTYTNRILKLDTSYVESVCNNYVNDNIVFKTDKIFTSYYPKPECTCPLCGAGNKKKHNRPAVFQPTEAGYLFKCLNCMNNTGAITLYELLLKLNPELARNYHWDRWINKTTGKDFNVPNPPKRICGEYYKQLEEEVKQRNKIAYQQRHNIINRNP